MPIATQTRTRTVTTVQHLLAVVFLLAALFTLPQANAATVGGETDKPMVEYLLDALAEDDYQRFISRGTPAFAGIGEDDFRQVSATVAPRLQQGYTIKHLGNLRQQGRDISVWKISFADDGDDLLATLNVTEGRVGGFFLR